MRSPEVKLPELEQIEPALPEACVVYGAGGFGQAVAGELAAAGTQVVAMLDRRGRELAARLDVGVPVHHPDDFAPLRDLPLVIGVCNPHVAPAAVADAMRGLGWDTVWSPVTTYGALGRAGRRHEHYWLTSDTRFYGGAADDIGRARSLLADERSVASFDRILAYRTTGNPDLLPAPDPQQYHPTDVDFVGGAMKLVDGGAYDGDTIRSYIDAGVDLATVAAFEPDPLNFERLVLELARHDGLPSFALPLGLGSRTGMARFDADGTMAAALADSGGAWIQCVALDDVLRGDPPTHVKLDIEGAEPQAIEGMRGLLGSGRPRLAVAAYHRPDHLWTLLLQIASYDLGYRFHLRCHAEQCFDTILYAIPAR